MSELRESAAWRTLSAHAERLAGETIARLFAGDSQRFERFSLEAGNLLLDFSRQRLDAGALAALFALAEFAQVRAWIGRLYAGEKVNVTENRAALHMALRARTPAHPAWRALLPAIERVRERMRSFVAAVHRGEEKGARGDRFTDVVNLGAGGSDLGPRMLVRALRGVRRAAPRVHFVASADPADLDAALADASPATTLFIVASKSFTTAETLANAARARAWLEHALGKRDRLAAHFVAVTANEAAALELGIAPERIFPLWDWVGGRFSVWSAIGLPVALAVGMEHFEALLEGARVMDEHFLAAAPERNLPLVLALLDVWNANFLGIGNRAVIPYSEDLRDLPAWLQQLEMESNGKRVNREGQPVDYVTAPLVWGASGTPSQHSFHQWLHQGTHPTAVDFIVCGDADQALLANALAQSAALAFGHSEPQAPHRALPGNRPCSLLVLARLDPHTLGQLLALYEHKVFAAGVLWRLNSFDQWGVEHGKALARVIERSLARGGEPPELDPASAALLARLLARRD